MTEGTDAVGDASQADVGVALAPVAASAALGDATALKRAIENALAAGCPAATLREALLMLAPFGGFPRTLDALAHFQAVLTRLGCDSLLADATLDDLPHADHAARGRPFFERVYGDDTQRIFTRLLALDPELPHWVIEDAYGRVLSRPGLAAAQRERLAVVFLCALRLPNQLSGHVRGALRCGATAAEVERSLAAAESLLTPEFVADARRVLTRAAPRRRDAEHDSEQE